MIKACLLIEHGANIGVRWALQRTPRRSSNYCNSTLLSEVTLYHVQALCFTIMHYQYDCERSEQLSAYVRFRGLRFPNKHVQMVLQIQIEILAESKCKLPKSRAEH